MKDLNVKLDAKVIGMFGHIEIVCDILKTMGILIYVILSNK